MFDNFYEGDIRFIHITIKYSVKYWRFLSLEKKYKENLNDVLNITARENLL